MRLFSLTEKERSLVRLTNSTSCRVVSSRFEPHFIEAQVEALDPSLIVLSQSFYHLWRASVDGTPVPILRANVAFQAVQVGAGTHRLVLQYKDVYFQIGAVISVLALAVCALLWFQSGPETEKSKRSSG